MQNNCEKELSVQLHTSLLLCLEKRRSYWEILKSHIDCLNSWNVTYIFIGQLQLMLINFKIKSNIVWE